MRVQIRVKDFIAALKWFVYIAGIILLNFLTLKNVKIYKNKNLNFLNINANTEPK